MYSLSILLQIVYCRLYDFLEKQSASFYVIVYVRNIREVGAVNGEKWTPCRKGSKGDFHSVHRCRAASKRVRLLVFIVYCKISQ